MLSAVCLDGGARRGPRETWGKVGSWAAVSSPRPATRALPAVFPGFELVDQAAGVRQGGLGRGVSPTELGDGPAPDLCPLTPASVSQTSLQPEGPRCLPTSPKAPVSRG